MKILDLGGRWLVRIHLLYCCKLFLNESDGKGETQSWDLTFVFFSLEIEFLIVINHDDAGAGSNGIVQAL